MKILWMGEDTSHTVPIGGNVLRRLPEFRGHSIHHTAVPQFAKSGYLEEFDILAYWGGLSDRGYLETIPTLKRRNPDAKIIMLLRATGTGIPSWHVDHQISIIKIMPMVDLVFTPHWDHFQYLDCLGCNVQHLYHAIDFDKYPKANIKEGIADDARIAIGSGGMEAHRGFFWSAIAYKEIKRRHPKVSGVIMLPEKEIETTLKFARDIKLEDVIFITGGDFKKYIIDLRDNVDVGLMTLMTNGNSRTLLDYSAMFIPCIHSRNIQRNFGDPFPDLSVPSYSYTGAIGMRFTNLLDQEFYRDVMMHNLQVLKQHDVATVADYFREKLKKLIE